MQTTYKHTPLGDIPQEWEVDSISNLSVKIGSGKTPLGGETVYTKSGIPFIRSQNVGWGLLDLSDVAFIPHEIHKTFLSSTIKSNDVLLNITGASIGRAAVASDTIDGGNVNQHVCIIRPNTRVVSYYLLTYLLGERGQNYIRIFQTGGNRQGLNFEQISQIPIPLPPIEEQKRIAALLMTWDERIGQQQALVEALQQRHKGLMQQLLTGKSRLPGFSGSWETVSLGDVANEVTQKIGHLVVEVLSCTKYDGLVDSLVYFGRRVYSEDITNYKMVKQGQFVYATNHIEEGSIGILFHREIGAISPMYTVFSTSDSNINKFFLLRLLKSPRLLYIYKQNMVGSIDRRGGLRWSSFAEIVLKIPALPEQQAIAEVLETSESAITQAKSVLETLKTQKKGLMQKLLSGVLRV